MNLSSMKGWYIARVSQHLKANNKDNYFLYDTNELSIKPALFFMNEGHKMLTTSFGWVYLNSWPIFNDPLYLE